MQLLLLLLIFRSIYGLIYEKEENRKISAKSVIHVEDDVASELTCLHLCLRLNSEALFTKKRCQCLGEMNVISNDSPLITGSYMNIKKTAGDERLKEIGPIKMKFGQQIAIIKKMKKEFHIQAIFNIDQSKLDSNNWQNLLHIPLGKDSGRPGDRHPILAVKKQNSNEIRFTIQWPYHYLDSSYPLSFANPSFKLDYMQIQKVNGYETKIFYNDLEVASHFIKDAQELENLIVYAYDPWHINLDNATVFVRFIKGAELKWRLDE